MNIRVIGNNTHLDKTIRQVLAEKGHALSDGDADVVWFAYNTPVSGVGVADVDWVRDSIKHCFPMLRRGQVAIVSSQVPVGFTDAIAEAYRRQRAGNELTWAYWPENMRIKHAAEDFRAGRIVIGTANGGQPPETLAKLAESIGPARFWTSARSAEMIKHATNAYLAITIAFANELAALSRAAGADPVVVEAGLGTDWRIGKNLPLRANGPYTNQTLGRDVGYLIDIAAANGLPMSVIGGADRANRAHELKLVAE